MDDIIFIPIMGIVFILAVVSGISYAIYADNETARIAMENRCELIKLDCSKNPVWGNCKGPVTQENK